MITKGREINMVTENKKDNDKKEDDGKKTLSLSSKTLSLGGGAPKSRSGGNSVTVEVKRKRTTLGGLQKRNTPASTGNLGEGNTNLSGLTKHEREARERALAAAKKAEEEAAKKAAEEAKKREEEDARRKAEGLPTLAEEEAAKKAEEEAKAQEEAEKEAEKPKSQREKELEELAKIKAEEDKKKAETDAKAKKQLEASRQKFSTPTRKSEDEEQEEKKRRLGGGTKEQRDWHGSNFTVNSALNYEYEVEQRQRSMASRRSKNKKNKNISNEPKEKQVRDVIIPETITVQELSKRMAEKSADVIKFLMGMGVMVTVNQSIDADTAELVVTDFGHKFSRVTEADVEQVIEDIEDKEKDLESRAPVVTIMGHVDHGKTSILDALRKTDVVAGEAGGITQHIGAYQIQRKDGKKISFIDTPGHAAFTEMRARGANVTDVVILVVAANDSVMPQTIEAIHHAKAADVPIIVAINKCDLPEANPQKVKEELLQHEVIVEDYSGDVQAVEVSAKTRMGLDALEEAVLLQAEMLELKANPNREGRGAIVEAELDKGRGAVATLLVQNGTVKVGDIFISGSEWGKVRALVNDKGKKVKSAGPSVPVEVLGLNGTPQAGDDFVVVKTESEAREISDYRKRKAKELDVIAKTATIDQLFAEAKRGDVKTLPVIIKGDVQGSLEAISGSLNKLAEDNDEVDIKILHTAVGEITEADVTLANASNAVIIAFNVRANAQARDKAKQLGREIYYYSIIYNIIDDIKAKLEGLLSPVLKENFIGYAEIRAVFNITKVGKVAGCMITDGIVKRGAKVRLLRDNVVIHEGTLKTLKREKDEVKEVREGMECGMAFEKYDDIKEGDVVECFEIEEIAKTL